MPTMVRLTAGQRLLVADKLLDAANLALGAMVFGQFLSDRRFSLALAAVGIITWVTLFVWGAAMGGAE